MSPTVLPCLPSRIHKLYTSTPPRLNRPPPTPNPRQPRSSATRRRNSSRNSATSPLPQPSEDMYFCPEEGLPTFVSGVPALTSGSEIWVAIHNHRPEPLRLHTGQTVGTLEIVALADSPPPPPASSQNRQPPVPEHLSPAQQQQLKALFQEFSDIISQGEDDLGCTLLLQHTIETEGPRSASRIAAKTQPFVERRWLRSKTDAVQRRHLSLQQPLGFTSCHDEKGRQPSVLCRLQATQRNYRERRSPHSSHRRPPRRFARGPLVLHPRLEKRVLAVPHPRRG